MSGISVQGFTDAPVPRVGITVDGLSASGPSRVTVWRSTAGGQRRKVRGWDRRQVYGSDYAIDYEAPLGRPVTYSLVVDVGAVVPAAVTATVALDAATGFIQDPLLPLGAIALAGSRDRDTTTVMAPAFKALEYKLDGSTVAIMGSREPVALTGQRLIAAGIDFSMVTRAAEQGTRLRNLFLDTPIVLIRPLPEWGDLPDLIYTAPAVTEKQFDTSIGGERIAWSIIGDSVRPPSINVLVALWTYDQVAALWSTYASAQSAASASAARYLDVQRDPTMGV